MGRIVQQPDYRIRVRLGGEPGQRALARLPGAVQGDDAGITQRFLEKRSGLAGYEVQSLVHPSIIADEALLVVI